MKKNSKLIIIFLFLIILTGCGKKSTYDISLDGSSNSYYNWTYTIEDESIIKVIDEKYFGNESDEKISGLGGTYTFKVQALKKGTTTIYFNYMRSWDEEDVLYYYSITLEVDKDLRIKKMSESGNYLSLMKFMKLDTKKLGLEKNFNDYMLIFSDDEVNVDDDICDWLVAYDFDGEIIESYAISRSSNRIYRNVDGEIVLVK